MFSDFSAIWQNPAAGCSRGLRPAAGCAKVRCLAARREPDVEIEVELSDNGGPPDWKYSIGITQQVRGFRQPILRHERVWKKDKLILKRPDQQDREDKLRLTQTHLEQISANADFRDVARFLESIRYLHLVPQLLRHPESFQGATIPEDPYGRSFLEAVARTPREDPQVPSQEICDSPAGSGTATQRPHRHEGRSWRSASQRRAYTHWRPNTGRQRGRPVLGRDPKASDRPVLVSAGRGLASFLLEEPELSLHSEVVKRLPALFYRLQRKRRRQIFVSTHSWDLLSEKSIGGEEVVMLRPDQEGTIAQIASSEAEVREMLAAGLSIADAALPKTAPMNILQLDLF